MHRPAHRHRFWWAVVATAFMSSVLAPAEAARYVAEDSTGDVWSPDSPGFSKEGSVVNTDLKRTTLSHRTHSILIRGAYTSLKKNTAHEIRFSAYLRTSTSRRYGITASVDPGGHGTSYFLWRGINQLPVECDETSGRTSFRDDQLHVRVPRECLGNPRWVRYQAVADSYEEEAGLFIDNAIGAGPRAKKWSARVPRG